ncbi:DUF6442 family protein [uncultured Subdoligranulum sp.]|uniref:DUF6442 family protein n=1 Tax=uncultured Subdoligranulum sp. TaxID=512298 RepID=UPI00260CC87D|nr:DUF6442 family protein [uncultured Subdoligranulum sp.]
MKQDRKEIVWIVVGVVLWGIAVLLLRQNPGNSGFWRALPYVCLGVGAGLLGQGIGRMVQRKALQSDPELARQQEIEAGDERNIQLAQRAKAKAFDLMVFVFSALLLVFALMGVEMTALLLLVAAYLLVQGYAVYCRVKLEKEM